MRIAVDARMYGPHARGIGRYVQETVDRILALDRENDYYLILSPENYDSLPADNPRIHKYLAKSTCYSVREQFEIPFMLMRIRPDIVHFPHFNVPFVCPWSYLVTIHDLILEKFPDRRASRWPAWVYRLKYWTYQRIIRRAVRRAKQVIAVSESGASDMTSILGLSRDKIEVVYEGVPDSFLEASHDYNENPPSPAEDYLLYVGSAYPHKNLERLLFFFRSLRAKHPGLSLCLVGRKDFFYERLEAWANENDLNAGVRYLGFVSDEELGNLYRYAGAFVFPTLYEGFGLPPLEAMASSCPVISSDRGPMREILGGAALYFDPEDEASFCQAVEKLYSDLGLRSRLIRAGFARLQMFSWQNCADQTLLLYKKCLSDVKK